MSETPRTANSGWTAWLQSLVAGVLFWVMFLVGSASFGATLLIPAWLDYVDARSAYARRAERNAALLERRTIVDNQIAHLKSDAFYTARYAEDELNFRTGYYETREAVETATAADPTDERPPLSIIPGDLPELAEATEQLRAPQGAWAIFLLPQARPAILILSGILIAGSLVTLGGRRGWAPLKS